MAENSKIKTIALWLGRLVLSGTFAFAAVQKISDPTVFATDIAHYRLLPHPLTLLFALYLPWLELICSASILSRRCERSALILTAIMCGIFSAALASAWFRGLDINCGCFGHSTAVSSLPLALARSFTLGCLALILFRLAPKSATTRL